jgi:hypothetical protein
MKRLGLAVGGVAVTTREKMAPASNAASRFGRIPE